MSPLDTLNPASVPAPAAEEPDPYMQARSAYAKQKERLIETQRNLMEELEGRRIQPAEKLMAFSQAMLTPGRTGSFGEAFGGAMGNLQKLQSEDAARAQAIAKMRMEMGMQQLGMAKEDIELAKQTQAMKLVSSVFGASPQQTAAALQAGTVPGGDFSRVTPELYMRVQQLDSKLAEGLKNAFGMDVERRKIVNDDIKNGLTVTELIAKYGEGVTRYLPPGLKTQASAPVAAPAPAEGIERFVVPTEQQALQTAQDLLKQGKKFTVEYGEGKAPEAKAEPSGEETLPLQTQSEIRARRITESEAEIKPLRDAVMAANPSVTSAKNRSLRELLGILEENRKNVEKGGTDIFGLLQKQGVLSAVLNAAQDGARAQAGTSTLSLSLPVETFIKNLQVPEELRPMLTRATQILAEQFLLNARANKGVLGTQVSNFDAQLMQAPMASVTDSSKSIEYWTKMNVLANKEREDTYKAYSKVPAERKYQFFNSPEYDRIVNQYNDYYRQFVQKYSPANQAAPATQEAPKDLTGRAGEFIKRMFTP